MTPYGCCSLFFGLNRKFPSFSSHLPFNPRDSIFRNGKGNLSATVSSVTEEERDILLFIFSLLKLYLLIDLRLENSKIPYIKMMRIKNVLFIA